MEEKRPGGKLGSDERELEILNETLSKLTAIRGSINRKLKQNEDRFDEILRIGRKWAEKKELVDKQKLDIELALDVVSDVDNNIRDLVVNLNKGLAEDHVEPYLKSIIYAHQILAKSREADLGPNSRLSELYSQLDQAVLFSNAELKRYFPIELSRDNKNIERLKILDKLLKKAGVADHYYDVVKVYGLRLEKMIKASIEGLLEVLRQAEPLSQELDQFIGDAAVVSKVRRNIYRQFSKAAYDGHFKPFLAKFQDTPLEEKKRFMQVTDKAYSMVKDLETRVDMETLMSMLTTFYFGLLDLMNSFCPNLERSVVAKPDQAFENATRTLCDILSIVDSQTGCFSVFLIKKNLGYSDAIDFSVKTASHFVKILKAKCDALKTKSQLHSNIFALKILDMIETEMKTLKKVSLKLKPGIDKSVANASKSYLYYCWAHVLGHKHVTDGVSDPQALRRLT